MKANSNKHSKQHLSNEELSKQTISARLQKLIGAVKLPTDFDEKKELKKYYQSKYF